ncbi:hypothetical protein D3C80_1374010 [compost metagenome]
MLTLTTSLSLLDNAVGCVVPVALLPVTTTTGGGAAWLSCWLKNSPLLSGSRLNWQGEGGEPINAKPLRMHTLALLGALAKTSTRVPAPLRE